MTGVETLICDRVCSPEKRMGCARNVGEIAVTLAVNQESPDTDNEFGFEPRPYQIEAWQNISEIRKQGDSKALVHLATGLGKTTVAVVDALRFIDEFNEGREEFIMPRILFAVHQNEILEQASERFKMFAPGLPQGYYSDSGRDADAPIVLGTLQSLYENLDKFDPNHFDYIVYDEAHHMQAETYKKVAEYFTPKFQLALTATPDRMDGLNIREMFGNEVYKKSLAEALVEGWLAEVDYHIVIDDAVRDAMETGFENMSIKAIKELLSNQSRNEQIANQIREEITKLGLENAKTILFCQSIEHAEEMAKILGGKAFHSKIDNEEKKATLKNFRSGGINLIATRDMFNEGVDIPDARLVVFLRSTGSRTIFEQQLGRGLRKTAQKDTVTVLDFVANIERLEHLKEFTDDISRIQNGDNNTPNEDKNAHETEGGLTLHSPHGDFDFDKIAVDLLDRISSLRREASTWPEVSNEDIVELALSISPNKPLTQSKITELSKSGEFPSSTLIRSRFGGIMLFAEACGFERSWKGATKEDILSVALSLGLEKLPTKAYIEQLASEGLLPTPVTIRSRFGSLLEFQQALGFGEEDKFKFETDEEIIEQAKRLSPDTPYSDSLVENFHDQGVFVSRSTIYSRFGGIKKFNILCGYEPGDTGSFRRVREQFRQNPESILDTAVSLGLEPPITKTQIVELSKKRQFVSYPTIRKLFGNMSSFNEALIDSKNSKQRDDINSQ